MQPLKRFEAHPGFAMVACAAGMFQKTLAGVKKRKSYGLVGVPAGTCALFGYGVVVFKHHISLSRCTICSNYLDPTTARRNTRWGKSCIRPLNARDKIEKKAD